MITIVGAGLGGLTLASVLLRNGITTVVYGADLSAAFRPQGGMLDIHQDTGQAALRAGTRAGISIRKGAKNGLGSTRSQNPLRLHRTNRSRSALEQPQIPCYSINE